MPRTRRPLLASLLIPFALCLAASAQEPAPGAGEGAAAEAEVTTRGGPKKPKTTPKPQKPQGAPTDEGPAGDASAGSVPKPPPRRPLADGAGDPDPSDAPDAPQSPRPPRRPRANALRNQARTFDLQGVQGPPYRIHMSLRRRIVSEGGDPLAGGEGPTRAERERYQRLKRAVLDELGPDAGFEFDDNDLRVDFRGNFFQLYGELSQRMLEQNSHVSVSRTWAELQALSQDHVSDAPSTLVTTDQRARFDAAFSSPSYRQARENQLRQALANSREFDYARYDATWGGRMGAAARQRLAALRSNQERLASLLQEAPGVVVGETHNDPSARRLLTQNMAALRNAEVNTLYVEHFRFGEHQAALDRFFRNPQLQPRDLPELQAQLGGLEGLGDMLVAARANNIRVVAIDDAIAETERAQRLESDQRFARERAARMNYVSADIINADGAARGSGRYVVLVGAAHSHTHPEGIPGMAQLMNVPAVALRAQQAGGAAQVELVEESRTARPVAARLPPTPDAAQP